MSVPGLGRLAGTVAAGAVVVTLGAATAGQEAAGLATRLEALRAKANLPAVAAVVFTSDAVIERAAVGVRAAGDPTPVEISDLWHIGSITKSFTSLLIARAVERGELTWDTTLASMLGADRAGAYGAVTVQQVLSHRAGLPANVPPALSLPLANAADSRPAQRHRVVSQMLAVAPAAAPGAAYRYSNVGYVLAGSWLEERTGKSWEDIVRAEILDPLALRSAGFGAPGRVGQLDQPRGHRAQADGRLVPVEPGPFADNLPYLGPAGTLHMSVDDLARWGQTHLAGDRGRDGLVRAETFRQLHQPAAGADYALGWVVVGAATGRPVVWHNGSNTMWYAVVGFDAAANRGAVVVTNGSIRAQADVDATFRSLVRPQQP